MSTERRFVNPRTGEVIDDPEIRPFDEVLVDLYHGETNRELSRALWDLLQRVQETWKAGSLTLKLTVSRNNDGSVDVKDEVALKLPDRGRLPTHFFIDENGNASHRNPNQPSIPGVTQIG